MTTDSPSLYADARRWLMIGAITCGIGVGMGAFGAHGLDAYFASHYKDAEPKNLAGHPVPRSQKALRDFNTGVRYQMYHGLGILAVALLMQVAPHRSWSRVAVLFTVGNILFSGGLYLYTITGTVFWGAGPPPFGGTCYVIGWSLLAWKLRSLRSEAG